MRDALMSTVGLGHWAERRCWSTLLATASAIALATSFIIVDAVCAASKTDEPSGLTVRGGVE